MLNPENTHNPIAIKVNSAIDTVKLTDETLIKWISELIQNAMEKLEFVPGRLGVDILAFVGSDSDRLLSGDQVLNYDRISMYANRTIRKTSVREKNLLLSPFLLRILRFLNNETSLCRTPTTLFTDKQLNFLYSLAVSVKLINDDRISSDGKDYIRTLLLNYIGTSL